MLKRIVRHERCRCVMGSLALLEAAGLHGFMHLEEQSQRLSYQDDDGIWDIWTTAQERFLKPYNLISQDSIAHMRTQNVSDLHCNITQNYVTLLFLRQVNYCLNDIIKSLSEKNTHTHTYTDIYLS